MDGLYQRSKWKRYLTTREVKKKYTTPPPSVHLKLNKYLKLRNFGGVPVAAATTVPQENAPASK
jgi:hypothetical protein